MVIESGHSFLSLCSGEKKCMRKHKKTIRAFTLTELLVVMAIMVILLAIATPVAKKLSESLQDSAGTRSLIDAALANARAIAIREGHYAGVRFQQDSNGQFYLIFIVNEGTIYANGFRVVEGKKPMKLPENVGVMGCRVQQNYNDNSPDDWDLATNPSTADTCLNTNVSGVGMNDATTFSVVFSPSGKFVVHLVRVYNTGVNDTVFNSKTKVNTNIAKFRQDGDNAVGDSDALEGYQQENSVSGFRIYDKRELAKAQAVMPVPKPWTAVPTGLSNSEMEFVNPYTGELVKKN
jgi:prepilin-type N-terminal cleavage/methylation domain-containing protein